MKLLLLFTICIALSYAEHLTVQVHDDDDVTRVGEGIVIGIIENIREDLKAKGFNNIAWDNKKININLEAQKLQVDLTASGYITGIADFEVEVTPIKWQLFNFDYKLKWPKIKVNLEPYDFKGYVSLIQLYGNGKIKLELLENLNVSGKISTILGVITGITTNVKLNKDLDFELTGWLNDEVRSEILSELVKSYVPVAMKKYEKEINEKVAEILLNFIKNNKLGEKMYYM